MNEEGKGETSETKARQSVLLLTVQNQCLISIRKIRNKKHRFINGKAKFHCHYVDTHPVSFLRTKVKLFDSILN